MKNYIKNLMLLFILGFSIEIGFSQCSSPTFLSSGPLKSDSYSGTYTGGSGSATIIEYGLSAGFVPGTTDQPGSANSQVAYVVSGAFNLTYLQAGVSYKFVLRNRCGSFGNYTYSANSPIQSFTTASCFGYLATFFNQNYDFSFNNNVGYSDDNFCPSYPAPGAEKFLKFIPPANAFYTFELSNNVPVNFSYKIDDASCNSSNLISCFNQNNLNTPVKFKLGPLTNGTSYMFFVDNQSSDNPCTVGFNDCGAAIKVNCASPDLFTVSNIQPNQLTLNWNCTCTDPGGNPTYIEYGPVGFFPGTGATAGTNGTLIANATSPLTITGLSTFTNYDFYLRTSCGTVFSPNIFQKLVRTAPDCNTAPVVYADSVYTRSNFAVGNLYPGAWRIPGCTSSYNEGSEMISKFTPTQTGNYVISIANYVNTYIRNLKIYTKPLSSTCNELNWTCRGDLNLNPQSAPATISLGNLNAGTTYMILIDTEINNAQTLTVKFRISNANNCISPMVYVNGYPSTTFPDQFQLKGACVSCIGSTYVEYGLSGFTPGTGSSPGIGGTLIANPVFPLTISGLTPAATYDVYTRENCGGSLGFSSNSIKTTITMPCNYGPSSISSNLTTICPGTVVNLTVNGGTPGPNGIYKIYSDSCGGTLIGTGTTTTVSPSKTTIYYARIESPCGNSNCVSKTIFVNPPATITPAGNTTFCSGSNVTLNANTGTGLTYQWKKYGNPIAGATASSYVATGSGSYRVVVTNASGCSASASPVTVTVNPLPSASITATGSTAICPGSSVTLNANTGTGLNYQWRKFSNDISGATGATYAATGAGTYKVRVTNANGCSKNSNSIVVTSLTAPVATITATGPTTFCAGDSVKLSAASGAGNAYQWRKGSSVLNGATGLNYYAKTTGNYKVTVTATNGCTKNSNVIAVNVPCRVGEFAEIPFDIYPNPSSGIFKVVNGENEYAKLEIKDVTGKLIFTALLVDQETEIDLTQFPAGIYIAFLKTNNSTQMKKLIIR
jgi:hypothetical protein